MNKILRISSLYENMINDFKLKNPNYKSFDYDNLLYAVFNQNYSVSNNYSIALNKINYQCNEIIENFNYLQKAWIKKYGDQSSKIKIIFQQIEYYKPEIIFIGNPNILNKEFNDFSKSKNYIKKIICFHCAPLNESIISKLRRADGIITCTKGYQNFFNKKIKKKTILIHHAFNTSNSFIKDLKSREIDIAFIGSIFLGKKFHDHRVDILYEVKKKYKNTFIALNFANYFLFKLVLYFFYNFCFKPIKTLKILYKYLYLYCFHNKKIYGNEMYKILANTKLLINSHIGDSEYSGNMRMFEGTGLGCLLLTDDKKGNEDLFRKNDIVVYQDKKHLFQKISYYLKNEKKRIEVASNGYQRTLKYHNYSSRAKLLSKFFFAK